MEDIERGFLAQMSGKKPICAQGSCPGERESKISCADVGWGDAFQGAKPQIILNYCVHLSLLRHINCCASAMQASLHCSRLLCIFAALRTKRNRYEQFYRSEMCNIAYCRCLDRNPGLLHDIMECRSPERHFRNCGTVRKCH